MIPQRAVQEFYDELLSVMESQPDEWVPLANDHKVLWVSPSDFDYYVQIRQQYSDLLQTTPIETDTAGLSIVFFYGIRVKPLVRE